MTNEGSQFYFKTNLAAGRYKLIAMDVSRGVEAATDKASFPSPDR